MKIRSGDSLEESSKKRTAKPAKIAKRPPHTLRGLRALCGSMVEAARKDSASAPDAIFVAFVTMPPVTAIDDEGSAAEKSNGKGFKNRLQV